MTTGQIFHNPIPMALSQAPTGGDGAASGAVAANGDASTATLFHPPRHLNQAQGEIFSELVGMLHPYRIIEEPDRPMLAELAQLLDETRELTRDIKQNGFFQIHETAMGIQRRHANPAVNMREKLATRAWAIIRAFGMTPAARRTIDQPVSGDNLDWLDEFGIQ